MTREEADRLQEVIDDYVEIRDRDQNKKYTIGDKEFRFAPNMMKMQIAQFIEPLLPEARLAGEGNMDFMAMLGPFASVLGVDLGMAAGTIPVVDGYKDVDPDDMEGEEYERLYCVTVPGDVMKESLRLRSEKVMFEMALEMAEKETKK